MGHKTNLNKIERILRILFVYTLITMELNEKSIRE